MRDDFRVFRVDRIEATEVLPELFVDEPGKTFGVYMGTESQLEQSTPGEAHS